MRGRVACRSISVVWVGTRATCDEAQPKSLGSCDGACDEAQES